MPLVRNDSIGSETLRDCVTIAFVRSKVIGNRPWQIEGFEDLFHTCPFLLVCFSFAASDRWNGSSINYIFGAGDRGGSIRGEKGDEFCNFVGPVWAPQRDASKHVHQLLT